MNPPSRLREDALAIWQAGVDAVRSDVLVRRFLRVDGDLLRIGEQSLELSKLGRIAVVGCGKAGAGMAAGVEAALGERLLRAKAVHGWVNVPEDCIRHLHCIELHPARPAGLNEPTEAGVAGAKRILQIVRSLGPDDLCLCLISGGGSALLPAPADGIRLADKQAVTKHLSGAGANIQQLNTVRKQLSQLKGGRLALACRAGHLISLIISDVLGDPLAVIASGPTVPDSSTPQQALEILEQFHARQAGIADRVFEHLRQAAAASGRIRRPSCRVTNLIIGNNATAVAAAAERASQLGYRATQEAVSKLEGEAEEVGRRLANAAWRQRSLRGKQCLVSGGEPTVRLVPAERRGLGGRNQQLILAALEHLRKRAVNSPEALARIAMLSGGTDGEDGPTDAAGAVIDAPLDRVATARGLDPASYLTRNDAYHFFAPLGGLIKTGPTHTNVCDVRVIVSDTSV